MRGHPRLRQILHRNLEATARRLGPCKVRVMFVDADACGGLASELGVQKLPTLLLLGPNGERPALRSQGGASLSQEIIEDLILHKAPRVGGDMKNAMLL